MGKNRNFYFYFATRAATKATTTTTSTHTHTHIGVLNINNMLPYRGPGIIVCYPKYFCHVAEFHVAIAVVVVAPQATLSEWVLLPLINVNCGLPLRPILTAGDWL